MVIELDGLKELALMGGLEGAVTLSATSFANILGVSPQTACRRLQNLEQNGLIKRKIVNEGQKLTLTDVGISRLKKEYSDYRQIFNRLKKPLLLKGCLMTGMGEGRYYISTPGYMKQIDQVLGFSPYPGTFNLHLDPESIDIRGRLTRQNGIELEGFTHNGRTFGSCLCYRARVEGIDAGAIIPERTHYPEDVLEVIAPFYLRERFGIKDGDEVQVEVFI